VNFAPLTRGTAVCGYAVLSAVMLACGYTFSEPLPQDIQMDWESIFSVSCGEFVDRMLPLLPIMRNCVEEEGIAVDRHVLTIRDMLHSLL
jgi:hypothetical protein